MKRLAVVPLIVAAFITLLPGIASATTLAGPPADDGSYMHCAYAQDANGVSSGTVVHWSAKCQYGAVGRNVATSDIIKVNLRWCFNSGCSSFGDPGYDPMSRQGTDLAGQFSSPSTTTTDGSTWPGGTVDHVLCNNAGTGVNVGWTSSYGDGKCLMTSTSLSGGTGTTMPTDNWPGGSAGPTLDVVGPTATCSDRLSAGNGTWAAFFTGGDSADATGATDTYSWAFGDSATSTVQSPTHDYANAGPFTAVITVSRTPTSGHLFTDGTSTAKTSTCTLTVDFNAGNGSTTTTTTPTGDNGTGSGSCDLWDVGCWVIKGFRTLFMPSSSTQAGMGQMWGDITTKAPFSVLYEVITYIPSELEHMAYATQHNQGDDEGPSARPNYLVDDGCYAPLGGGTGPFPNTNTCMALNGSGTLTNQYALNYKGIGTGENNNATTLIRTIFLWVIGILFAYACYRGVGEILK